MKRIANQLVLLACGAMLPLFAPRVFAQPAAPVPAQIASAKTAFLANAGSTPANPQLAVLAYNSVYQDIAQSHGYRLTAAPADADLVLEVSVVSVFEGGVSFAQYIQLAVRDEKSQSLLWTLSESIPPAAREKTLEKNVTDTAQKVAADLATLASGNSAIQPKP
jgi:hypothetical protein